MPSKLTHHLEYHLRRNPHPLLIRFNKDPQTNPGCSILELFILGSLKPGVYFRLYFGGKNLLCKHHFSSVRQRYFHAWPWVQDLRVAIRHRTEQMGSVQLGLQSLFGVCNSKTPRISLAFCGPRKVIEGPLKALVKPCCLVHPMSKTVGKQPSSVGNLGYNAHDSCSLCCSGPKQKQNPKQNSNQTFLEHTQDANSFVDLTEALTLELFEWENWEISEETGPIGNLHWRWLRRRPWMVSKPRVPWDLQLPSDDHLLVVDWDVFKTESKTIWRNISHHIQSSYESYPILNHHIQSIIQFKLYTFNALITTLFILDHLVNINKTLRGITSPWLRTEAARHWAKVEPGVSRTSSQRWEDIYKPTGRRLVQKHGWEMDIY